MNKILILLIPLILFSGCFAPMEPKEPTGKAIAVAKIQVNYPVELRNHVSSLGKGEFVLTSSKLSFIKTGEKFSVEINKRGVIDQYAFWYKYTLSKPLSIGESVKGYWLHKKAVITYTNSNTVTIEVSGQTIQLKNFNAVKSITAGKYNTEFILKNKKLVGLKVYNTGPNINVESIYS